MGIPKFYRWTSERYPCLYEKIREYQIPEFDNLYLDMNGIIHNCSHPNDEDIHLRIPEESIFKDIFHYIDFLFRMIKPCRVFFMAIDGVAPRAKMNQQRGRRFRSARVAEEQEAEAVRQGEKLPSEERFDSNCITPGTAFMARLHEQLKYFVSVKVSTDPLWQRKGLCIYLSGHDVPGEGEHKIMDFIRHIRSQPEYDPDTRHCLYGLDADLMMLGLSTHELRFALLREEVKFAKPKKKKNGKNPQFQNKKFKSKDEKAPVAYDLTNVSVFTNESTLGLPSDSIATPSDAVDLNSISSVKDGKSFSNAMCLPPSSFKAEKVPQQVAKIPRNPVDDGSAPPPPPPVDDHNAKGDYKAPLPEKTTFFLLHLSLFRDYLDEEFKELRDNLKEHPLIKYDLESLIDDWILMNILVGNDFVPHLPNLHIVKGALPMLYRTYMDVLPTLDGYLNENGRLNLKRFEVFIKRLSQFDLDQFRETYDDMKYKASKTGKNIVLGEKMFDNFIFEDTTPFEEEELEAGPISDELKELAKRTEDEIFGGPTNSDGNGLVCKEVFPDDEGFYAEDDTEEFRLEFLQHKRNYYLTKCEFKKVDRDAVHSFAEEYVRAIQWVLLYYYKGVSSWGWFYPSHYAPYSSDLRGFGDFNIEFTKGTPFKPFEQLLAVLPSQSKKLLPQCYQWLMTEDNSPILEYYPKKFDQDLNGKKQDWEAVVLIPFIDEPTLLSAMKNEATKLSDEERFRNLRGQLLCYSYTKENTGPIKSYMGVFPELEESHLKLDKIDEVNYNPKLLPKGLHKKANIKKIYQGFPSLKSKTFESTICKAEVKVFEFYAREESLILSFEDIDEEGDGMKLGKKILGQQVWVNWPHLEAAFVTAIYTRYGKYILGRDNLVIKDPRTSEDAARRTFEAMAKGLVDRHLKFRGIRLGTLNAIVNAKLLEGRKMRCNNVGKVVLENQWSKIEQPFALKTAIFNERVTEMFYMDKDTAKTYLDLFRIGDQVFYLGDKMFGAMGQVVDHDKGSGSVVVELKFPSVNDESNLKVKTGLSQLKSQDFFPPYEAASKCHISSFALARLTGRVLVSVEKPRKESKRRFKKKKELLEEKNLSGSDSSESSSEDFPVLEQEFQKLNIGLDLKFNKTNMEVRGYTSKRDGQWHYSANTIKLVNEFVRRFPNVVLLLGRSDKNKDVYTAKEVFPDCANANEKVLELVQWLEDSGVRNLPRIPTNCNVLDDEDIDNVWKFVSKQSCETPETKQTWTARPNLLYKPGLDKGCIAPIPNAQFALLDRVICVDRGASIPLGLRGTVVGIQAPPKTTNDDNEEAFKSVSADALNMLIIMCDPVPDVFDLPTEKSTQNEITELTGSLAKLLGVGGAQEKQISLPKKSETVLSKQLLSRPKLVKLFPYQVINLTQGAWNLRNDLKKVPMEVTNKDRSSLLNGTAIVKMPSYAQTVASGSNNTKVVKILRNPNAGQSNGKKEIPPLISKEQVQNSQSRQKEELPWPPQLKSGSITVAQLFAAQAQSSRTPSKNNNNLEKASLKMVPTQILRKPKANQSTPPKKPKDENRSKQKEEVTLVKRNPLLEHQLKQITDPAVNSRHFNRVFVNSAYQKSSKKDEQDGIKSENSNKQKAVKSSVSDHVKGPPNISLMDLLYQPKNVEKMHNNLAQAARSSTSNVSKDNHVKTKNGYVNKNSPVQLKQQSTVGQSAGQGQFQHPVVYPSHPMEILQQQNSLQQQQSGYSFAPAVNYIMAPMPGMPMWFPNPGASAFTPQHHFHPQMMGPVFLPQPPPPPQHWTKPASASAPDENQSYRQMKGTKKSNVFIPLQVSRSLAVNEVEPNENTQKKEASSQPAVEEPSVSIEKNVAQQIPSAPAKDYAKVSIPGNKGSTNTLKALLGVTQTQAAKTETVQQPKAPKPSRIAANFFPNQG